MEGLNLVLSIPQGSITATSLGIEGLARHRSPGSGKHFKGRKLFADLALKNLTPDFSFLEEGNWRNTKEDTEAALAAVAKDGKRTKTALSNNAFSCTPVTAYKKLYLVKTGGEVLGMNYSGSLHVFKDHHCDEGMTPAAIADEIGVEDVQKRQPRLYLVICPIEILLFSNLTPIEYAWYATHRPGKKFRQVIFTELITEPTHLAAQSRYRDARDEINADHAKKTKTIVSDNCMNDISFHHWLGYDRNTEGGVYIADNKHVSLWRFPEVIPSLWERAG